jgi:hypothetical protein
MMRSRKCWTRCAAPRTLLSSNPAAFALVGIFLAGAILFIIGTLIQRERAAQIAPSGGSVESAADIETRVDMVERLAMLGQPWCVEQLTAIRNSDPDETVRDAADAALTVIGARRVSS